LQGEQYNRQLHPSEQQLAQTLAAHSNGRYTTQQIEDALRLSGYSLGAESVMPGETSQTGSVVDVKDAGSIYDTQASWLLAPGPNGSQYLIQQVPSQVSPDLAAYIIANTGGASSPYAWGPDQEGMSDGAMAEQKLEDWASSTQVGTRALGGLQMVDGGLEVAGGMLTATTCETGLGCAGAMYLTGAGLDNAKAGSDTLMNGQPTATLGEQALQGVGLSPYAASLVYGATQVVPAGVEGYAVNVAADAQAAANAAARGSYAGGANGIVPSNVDLPPQQVGSPYFVRINPATGSGPIAIDSTTFTSGTQTLNGGIRNARQFWSQWSDAYPETLSGANVARIQMGQSPIVDDTWISEFPEHADYSGETLIHHHLDYGPDAIPLPGSVHSQQPGWGIWHPNHAGQ
jgi:hypothetical protein